MSNCSRSLPQNEGFPGAGSPVVDANSVGRWPYGGRLLRSRRQLPPASYYRPPPNVYQQQHQQMQPQYQQQPPPRPAHVYEARPLPSVSLAEQGLANLRSWVSETKQRVSCASLLFAIGFKSVSVN